MIRTLQILNKFENVIIGKDGNVSEIVSFYNLKDLKDEGISQDFNEDILLRQRDFYRDVIKRDRVQCKTLKYVVYLKNNEKVRSMILVQISIPN